MSDPAYALQVAIFTALKGHTDAGNNVFDMVPNAAVSFPRITLGEGQSNGVRADCYDGSETFLEVNVWSRKTGFPEAKQIASQVRTLLDDAALPLDGHVLDLMDFQTAVASRDPDGLTSRLRMTFRALTHAVESSSEA